MGVQIVRIRPGDGRTFPRPGGEFVVAVRSVLFLLNAVDSVKINYTGTLLDGKKFDSSLDRWVHRPRRQTRSLIQRSSGDVPFMTQIGVGKVIRGWDEGIIFYPARVSPHWCAVGVCKLSKGEKALLIVTPDYVRQSLYSP